MFGGKVGGTSLTFLGSLILGVPALAVFGGGPGIGAGADAGAGDDTRNGPPVTPLRDRSGVHSPAKLGRIGA